MTFSDQLKAARKRLRLTQAEAADALGEVSAEAISKWERNLSTPNLIMQEGVLARLAKMKPKK